jgi:hypothetical protein
MRALVLLVLAVGCGGMSYDEFVTERADAECDYLVRCHAVSSAADCRDYFARTQVDSPSVPAALDASKLSYDEDAAEACIDAFADLSCDVTAQTTRDLAPCGDVLAGKLADGAACGFDRECESTYCDSPSCTEACCLGACRPPRPLPGVGDPCTALCDETSFCGADSICAAYLPEGAACDAFNICGTNLYCAGQATGPGSCAPLPHLGETCDGPCAEVNAICNDGTCIPGGLAGDPCDDAFDCSHYYSCEGSKCGAYPALGASCTNRCADGAFCEGGTCVAQKATGAACLYNDECTSHLCERELCYEPTICI